jgi:hypothetical protein
MFVFNIDNNIFFKFINYFINNINSNKNNNIYNTNDTIFNINTFNYNKKIIFITQIIIFFILILLIIFRDSRTLGPDAGPISSEFKVIKNIFLKRYRKSKINSDSKNGT